MKPELVKHIQGQVPLEYEFDSEEKVTKLHDKAVALFEELHKLPLFGEGFQEREEFFRDRIKNDPDLLKLKDAFDLWCSIWFWPGDWLDEFTPTPDNFYNPTHIIINRSKIITKDLKFFHWELEFPDVFISEKCGFDALLGNPPWENEQPNPAEFFTKYNPIFRTLSRMDSNLTYLKQLNY